MKKSKAVAVLAIFLLAWVMMQPTVGVAKQEAKDSGISQREYDRGFEDGKKAAQERLNEKDRKSLWFGIGLLSGLSIVGTIVVLIVASSPPRKGIAEQYMKVNISENYKRGFIKGFQKTLSKERTGQAAFGASFSLGIANLMLLGVEIQQHN